MPFFAEIFFRAYLPNVRAADLVDIALVAALLYVLVTLVRDSLSRIATRRLSIVIILFSAVYILVRLFEMYLFEKVMQVLLLVSLLAAVSVFQSDIRRMLDRLGSVRLFRNTAPRPVHHRTVDMLTEATARLAEEKMGALIALKGRDQWDAHVQGGVLLQGRLSQPLLYSIFDKQTPGHDGALLIEGDTVTRFAAHLPLSADVPAVSRFGGTRHSAALGLAEVCDALVIAVSEERGTITVAERGIMTEMATPSELKVRLMQFWQRHYATPALGATSWFTRRSLVNLVVAFTAAFVLWLLFAYSPNRVLRTVEVPIEFLNVPENWEIVEPQELTARVTLTGSEQAFRTLEQSALALSIEVSEPVDGVNTYVLSESQINLPSGVRAEKVQPERIRVTARQMRLVSLPVRLRFAGALPDSLLLAGVTVEPDSVRVLVPIRLQHLRRRVHTEEIDLDEVRAPESITVPLVPPEGTRLPEGTPGQVQVEIIVRNRAREAIAPARPVPPR